MWHCPHLPTAAAAVDRYLLPAGTDRWTPYRFIDPAPHTMRAVPTTIQWYNKTPNPKWFMSQQSKHVRSIPPSEWVDQRMQDPVSYGWLGNRKDICRRNLLQLCPRMHSWEKTQVWSKKGIPTVRTCDARVHCSSLFHWSWAGSELAPGVMDSRPHIFHNRYPGLYTYE